MIGSASTPAQREAMPWVAVCTLACLPEPTEATHSPKILRGEPPERIDVKCHICSETTTPAAVDGFPVVIWYHISCGPKKIHIHINPTLYTLQLRVLAAVFSKLDLN